MNVFPAAALLISVAGFAHADQLRADRMTRSQVTNELLIMGFTIIGNVQAGDGLWQAKAMKNGMLYEIDLDPYSGQVIRLTHNDDNYYEDE
jgi:hypothetical protein